MDFKEFTYKILIKYCVLVTCITIAMGVSGTLTDPSAKFGYMAFFIPLIYAVFGVLTEIVTYSTKELKLQQMLVRKVLQLIILEVTLLAIGYFSAKVDISHLIALAICILLVYVAVSIILWFIDYKKASELNMVLKTFQSNK